MPGGETLPKEERIKLNKAKPGGMNVRGRFSVRPGFSLLDWNELNKVAKDLARREGKGIRNITRAELREHRSEHDCWTVFKGNVYNITPFLAYHPGGPEELMKGAGIDCTALFNKYHPWVSGETMMGNLLLGKYVNEEAAGGDDEEKEKNDMGPPPPMLHKTAGA
ncbi:unnamed protein product [Chrysoparadoxa australica]